MNRPPPYAGGCACGGLRYVAAAETIGSRICHCRACQRWVAGPFLAHATFPRAALMITGETGRFRSSQRLWRHFCPACGTSLFVDPVDAPERIGVLLATLDDPSAIPPEQHIWVENKLPWVTTDDGLPQHPRGSPDPYRTA